MAFDLKKHIIKVQGGREYLPVSARLVWFRSDHPDWGIVTEPIEINLEKQYAIFLARIYNEEGKLMATGTKMENVRGFGDYLEKAETGSVGRALAMCGYGTQYATELEEGNRLADAPYPVGGNRFASRPERPQYNGGGNNNGGNAGNNGNGGNGGGNGMNNARPLSPRPNPAPAPPPRAERPERVEREESEEDAFPEEAPRAAAPTPPPARPAPAGRPPVPGAPITRVREPEPEHFDPGDDDEDETDPFADDEPAPAPRVETVSRPAASAPTEAPASNRCSVEGCGATLNPAQLTMSINKFGKPLCLAHQKDATPIGGAGAGAGRGRKASSNDATLL